MAYPSREVMIRFTVRGPNPDGTYAAETKQGGWYWFAKESEFEPVPKSFDALMTKNGELENKILHLEDQITALENQLVEYEQFKDLIRSFVR